MRRLAVVGLLVALASPALGAGTWHTFIPRSRFKMPAGTSCIAATLSGGGGIGTTNKDVLDCPAANANAFFSFEFWFPYNQAGNQISFRLVGQSDQAEAGIWCNGVGYAVNGLNLPSGSDWAANPGYPGLGTIVYAGAAVLTPGGSHTFIWPANGTLAVTAYNFTLASNCSNATPSDCAGGPGLVFVRRGIPGIDACGAGSDIGHTVHYIGADVSGTWP